MGTKVSTWILAALAAAGTACEHHPLEQAPPLAIVSITPSSSDSQTPSDSIAVVFSKPLDPKTVTTATFSVTMDGAPVPGTVAVHDSVAVFWLATATDGGHRYRADLSTGIRSNAGNVLPADVHWDFGVKPVAWPAGILVPVPLRTYEGSGQAIHPSVLYFPAGFVGWRYVMAITPYPFTDAQYENPSVYGSMDGIHWYVPVGVENPLVLPGDSAPVTGAAKTARLHAMPAFPDWGHAPIRARSDEEADPGIEVFGPGRPAYGTHVAGGCLSDPDLVVDPATGRLRLYFRQASGGFGNGVDVLFVMESSDLAHWTAPVEVMRGPHASLISPTFVFRGGQWQMWAVSGRCGDNATAVRYATSQDGMTDWSPLTVVSVNQPGFVIWHIQVREIASTLWALYSAYPVGQGHCTPGELFLARSADALAWQVLDQPVLSHLGDSTFSAGFYRSSLIARTDQDTLGIWISGFEDQHGEPLKVHTAAVKVGLTGFLANRAWQ